MENDKKVPYQPLTGKRASASKPNHWGTLKDALYGKDKYSFTGIGFVFARESGIVGIDIDHCLQDGLPNDVATAILEKLPPTYIEVSPSGTGLHIFLRGELPAGGNKNTNAGVEIYDHARYFTMTGQRWQNCADEIALDSEAISWIHTAFILKKSSKQAQVFPGISSLSDDKLLEAARAAKDSAAFSALWAGQWQGKYNSQSEADFALCRKLAFWSNRDEMQMDRLFRQSGLFRDKWDERHAAGGETYGARTLRRACETTEQTYSPPRAKNMDIAEQGGCYFLRNGDKVKQLTTFIVRPGEMIMAEDEVLLSAEFVSDDGVTHTIQLKSGDLTKAQKLKEVLNAKGLSYCFYGSDSDLVAFQDYLRRQHWKLKKGVRANGIYLHRGQFVFVSEGSAIAAGGAEVNTIVLLQPESEALGTNILKQPLLSAEPLRFLGEMLLSYNEPAKTVPILAWCAGCFIKQHLNNVEAKYPHLFLIGESGSGKSETLEHVIQPMFSRKSGKIAGASQFSGFSLMKQSATSSIVPQALDEFKPSKIKPATLANLYNHFRDSYDGHEGMRGRPSQTTVSYPLMAPLVVAGEESAGEVAIRDRTIELLFSRKDLKNEAYKEVFLRKIKKSKALLRSLGRSLLEVALSTKIEEVEAWYAEGEEHFSGDFPSRVTSNIACAFAGLKLVQKLCHAHGLSWDAVFPLPLDACAAQLAYATREYLLDGGASNRSVVEQTFELLANMNLKHDVHYVFQANGRELCIHFAKVYDLHTKYRKDYAVAGEVLTKDQFFKQLEHTEYFIKKDYQKRIGGKPCRTWVIDFEKLSNACDVSGFLDGQNDE